MILLSAIEAVGAILIYRLIPIDVPNSYISWVVQAVIVSGLAAFIVVFGLWLFRRNDFYGLIKKTDSILRKRNRQ